MKYILALLIIIYSIPATADLCYDPQTKIFSTIPDSPDIDQKLYHRICCKLRFSLKGLRELIELRPHPVHKPDLIGMGFILSRLRGGSGSKLQTSLRLRSDISKLLIDKFKIYRYERYVLNHDDDAGNISVSNAINVDVNPTQKPSQDMLHEAILNNSRIEVKAAIRAGAQVNFERDSDSPLFKAVLLRKSRAVEALLECGANANISYLGKPIVHYAIKGDFESARLLIRNGADFSGFMEGGKDIFTYVSTHPQLTNTVMGLTYELANHGYDINKNFNNANLSNNAWYLAIKNNQVNHILFFLNKYKLYPFPQRANPNQVFILPDGSSRTPLLLAIDHLEEHLLQPHVGAGTLGTLLKYGADVNLTVTLYDKKHSPLSFVLAGGNWTIINQLIEKGANIKEAYELFLQHGGSPDYTIKGPSYYIEPNGKVNYIGCTLLGLAIECNNKEAVEVLLNSGAYINLPTDRFLYINTLDKKRSFKTPLSHALVKGNSDIINLLVDKGAHV